MIPSYDRMDERRLEEVLRERAFGQGADLWVGKIEGEEWRAAYRHYSRTVGRSEEFTETEAAVGATKRAALVALAQIDDIGTIS